MEAMMKRVVILGACILSMVGCVPLPLPPQPPTSEALTPVPVVTETPTAVPSVVPTTMNQPSLTIWWPDVLMPTQDDQPLPLYEHLVAFAQTENGVSVKVRIKRVSDVGGIMSTLRTAREVAPSALPDMTLLRRQDLLDAVQRGLVQPLDGLVPTSMIDDLYEGVLQLGLVQPLPNEASRLYGFPYSLNFNHLVYESAYPLESSSYDAFFDNEIPLLLSTQEVTAGINPVFLTQYLQAGGRVNADGTLHIDENALSETLRFYEEATKLGLIHPLALQVASSVDLAVNIEQRGFGAAVVDSSLYLSLEKRGLKIASLPTHNGSIATFLDGWMWVVITQDSSQQQVAIDLLAWMVNFEQQSELLRLLNVVPAQRATSRNTYGEDYDAFVARLLPEAQIPMSIGNGTGRARALQSAFMAVVSGEQSSQVAVQSVLSQFPN